MDYFICKLSSQARLAGRQFPRPAPEFEASVPPVVSATPSGSQHRRRNGQGLGVRFSEKSERAGNDSSMSRLSMKRRGSPSSRRVTKVRIWPETQGMKQ